MPNFGIPQNLEQALSTYFANNANRVFGGQGALRAGKRSQGEGGQGFQDLMGQLQALFSIQDRKLGLGRLYGSLGGLSQGITGGSNVGRF